MAAFLPPVKDFKGKTYKLTSILGRGASGEVGLYRCDGQDPIVVKANYCRDPDAESKGAKEAQMANQAAAAVGNCDASISRCAACSLTGDSILRAPLSTEYMHPCSFAIYRYEPNTLANWLAANRKRSPEQVVFIFRQLLGIVSCLVAKGFYYTDLKPSNFLVSGSNLRPRLTIGDLGGLDKADMKQLVITPERLPRSLRQGLDLSKLDQVSAYLLGVMALELILRPSQKADSAHPLDAFLNCLDREDNDSCIGGFLASLKSFLAPGLSLGNQRVRDLAAVALTLLGYRGLFLNAQSAAEQLNKREGS